MQAGITMRFTGWLSATAFCFLALWCSTSIHAQEHPSPTSAEQYRTAVALQNRQMYDLAAKEWSAFLDANATDPLAANARYYLGVCCFQQSQFDKAEQNFAEVIKTYPNSELIADSMLNLGLAQFNLGQAGDKSAMRRAIKTLSTMREQRAASSEAKQATPYLAEAYYAVGELDEAISAFQQAAEQTTDEEQRAKILLGYGIALQDRDQPKRARQVFDTLLAIHPSAQISDEARMHRADTLWASGQRAEAEAEFVRLAQNPHCPFADYIRMRLASAQYGRKQFAQSARSYADVVARFPESEYVAEATVAAGKCHYLDASYDQARIWLERALRHGGATSLEATHWMARTDLARGDAAAALALIDAVLPKSTADPVQVELQIDRADALYELPGQRAAASQAYAAIADRFPQHEHAPYSRYMAALAAVEAEQFDLALRHVAEFLRQYHEDPLVPDVLAVAAESHLQNGEHAKAGKIYAQLLQDYSHSEDAERWRVRAALCANLADDHHRVITLLGGKTRQIKEAGLRGEACFLLGAAYLHMQDTRSAIRELKQSMAEAPSGAQTDRAMLLLAKGLRGSGELDQAQGVLTELAQRFPHSKILDRALLEQAELAANRGDHEQAETLYQQVIASYPDSPASLDAMYGWGWSLLHAEKFEIARQVFDKLLKQETRQDRQVDCYYARAVTMQQLGKTDLALQDLDRYLQTAPSELKRESLADANYLRGICLVQQSEVDKAIESFQTALRIDTAYPDADKVLYELAWAQQAAHQPQNAIRTFRQLARRYPHSGLAAEAAYRAAEADFAAQDYRRAARGFADASRRVSEVDAELNEQCRHKLGWSLFHLGEFDDALAVFRNQLQKMPSRPLAPDAQLMVGECLYQKKEFAAAGEAFQLGLGQTSTNDGLVTLALLHAGQAAGQQKQWQASIQRLDQLLQRFPESSHAPAAEYEKAWALQNLGNSDRAEPIFARLADAHQSLLGAKSRFMQGEIQFSQGNFEAAISTFFKVAYGFGHPDAPQELHEWQANALFEAARCCEATKRRDAARKLYRELVDSYPASDKTEDARRKLATINKP